MSSEAALALAASRPRVRRGARRTAFLLWLRRTHLYLGLWGAALGLLFGATGIVLNHRAVLKLPVDKVVPSTIQLAVPPAGFDSPDALAAWLRAGLGFAAHQVVQVRAHPAHPVTWAGGSVTQPERWTVNLQNARRGAVAEYFPGNRFVRVDRVDATWVGTLTRLHTSVGAGAAWVLLMDTIAGSLVLLSLTGLLLWTQLNTLRLAACAASVSALAIAMVLAVL